MELRTVFEEARDLAARLYVLAAPLHNERLPGALSDRPDEVVCLMEGGSDVQAVSPHLVHIPLDRFEAACEWLGLHGPVSPCAMVIASPLSLVELEAHLKPLLRVHLPDDTPIVLAC